MELFLCIRTNFRTWSTENIPITFKDKNILSVKKSVSSLLMRRCRYLKRKKNWNLFTPYIFETSHLLKNRDESAN